jgi:nicotinic acid mononucleotide adenylyltransferase
MNAAEKPQFTGQQHTVTMVELDAEKSRSFAEKLWEMLRAGGYRRVTINTLIDVQRVWEPGEAAVFKVAGSVFFIWCPPIEG